VRESKHVRISRFSDSCYRSDRDGQLTSGKCFRASRTSDDRSPIRRNKNGSRWMGCLAALGTVEARTEWSGRDRCLWNTAATVWL